MKNDWPATTAKVAYLGPVGTYSHAALQKFFGSDVQEQACTSITDIFASVVQGEADFGVVPVENSSEGSVAMTLDCFGASALHIYGEIMVRIRHCLLVNAETARGGIEKIVSHQQSLGQCREWLRAHYPDVERVAVSSNGEAARIAARENSVAAIAGLGACELYGLQVQSEGIEDTHDNTTRFLVISHHYVPGRSDREKTSIVISAQDAPGTLFRALEPFHRFGVSLTKLESRPSRKSAWSYSFFIDLLGHVEDEDVGRAIGELQDAALDIKLLGSYPAASMDH